VDRLPRRLAPRPDPCLLLRDPLHTALLAQERSTPCQSAELSLPQSLPSTTVIITNTPRTHRKHSRLHLLHMSFRNNKRNLVHTPSLYQHVSVIQHHIGISAPHW